MEALLAAPPIPTLPITGRDADIEKVLATITAGAAGRPGFLFVTGEAGVGRSRLLADALRRCRTRGVRAFLARPDPDPLPFSLFASVMQDMGKVYFPGRAEVPGLAPAAAALLRGDETVAAEAEQVHGGIRSFLAMVGRIAPVSILIDDFAGCDHATLGAISFLARVLKTPGDPIVRASFVMAARSDDLESHPAARELVSDVVSMGGGELSLGRLTADDVTSLVAAAFPGRTVDARLGPLVFEQSQGNPLYVLSLLDHMRGDGSLSMEGSIVRITSGDPPDLPANLMDLLLQKLVELDQKELQVLALGCVGGPRLDVDFLVQGMGWPRPEVLAVLRRLAKHGRLVRLNNGTFELDPPAASKIIYQELTEDARAQFHQIKARHLESGNQQRDDRAYEIASHLDRGGLPEEAAPYYLRGARHFRERFAWPHAMKAFDRYLALAKGETLESVEALLGISEALLAMGQLREAESPIDETVALAKKLDLTAYRGTAIMLSARRLFMLGDSRGALIASRMAQEIFESLGLEALLARVVELKGEVLDRTGCTEEAEIALEAALSLFTKVGDPSGRASILLELATISRETARFERAVDYLAKALETVRAIGDNLKEAAIIKEAGFTRWLRGEHDQGRQLIRHAVSMQQRLGNPRGEAEALEHLAYALGEEGDLDGAIAAATEARDLSRALADRADEARSHALLASLFAVRGPLDEARAYGSAAMLILDEVGDRRAKAAVLAVLARVSIMTGEHDQAQRQATESLGIAENIDDHSTSGLALAILGALLMEKGDVRPSRELLERAVLDLKAARADTHMPRVKAALGRAIYLSGDVAPGLAMLTEAIRDADTLASAPARAECLHELGRALGAGDADGLKALAHALEVAQSARLAPLVQKIQASLGA